MKFVKYNDNKSVTIPPAVLTVCGLDDEGKLEMAGARGAVILSKSEMTAMEMVRTILALTDRAGQLMRELTERCGSCEGCTEGHCTFRDADIEELIRPAVTVPDWAREEADIAPDAKLDCHVDEGSGVITVCETFYDHDLSDIPAELLEALRKSGCCLSVLEDKAMVPDRTQCSARKELIGDPVLSANRINVLQHFEQKRLMGGHPCTLFRYSHMYGLLCAGMFRT